MKALFLSITAGHGHNQAAKAVMSYLEEKNVECTMLDTFEYINPILSESVAKGYLISTKFTPSVYGKLYRLAEKRDKSDGKISITRLINSILSKKLITFLNEYKPDVIICTHIFSAQIVTYLQKKGLKAKSIGIVTDFTIHPFWEETDLDCYVTASELLNPQALKKGIDISKIYPIGIPIHKKFSSRIDRLEARNMLGIEDKTTLFIMSGSMGYGNVLDIIRQVDHLDMDLQIISVCGNNKRLKHKIDALEHHKKIYNYGFVDNVDIMMDASNCIITKPGGLTISESLAKRIPIIIINPIPGQEDRNVEFLQNNGLAIKLSKTYTIHDALYNLMHNKWRLKNMDELIKYFSKPHSSRDLGELIIKMGNS